MGQQDILEFLRGRDENSATVEEMADALGVHPQSVRDSLYRMQRRDEVRKEQEEYFDPATWFLTGETR